MSLQRMCSPWNTLGWERQFFCCHIKDSLTILRLQSPNRKMSWKKSFLIFLFSLLVPKGAAACKTMKKTEEFSSPYLNSETKAVTRGQNVSLVCSIQNSSLQITYRLFRNLCCLDTQNKTGDPMVVNLTIAEVHDLGPYKCKATVSNCSKYSSEFNFTFVNEERCPFCLLLLLPGLLLVLIVIILILAFWILPKDKARKTMREQAPRDCGKTPAEAGIYANICPSQAETRHSQEIHYSSPVFQEAAPREREASNDCKTACVYSELTI
ncbi:allergin-1 [Talpa occidentalis]|uniref:allergin-1 n=1 Tax=Talpa occidentalis TaxID=50954 RepID=UPI00188E1D7E|nr:allergin-1 [Talpa occidentalis]XP_054545037.1 allergin-1 [Talpa occidentalis]